MMGNAQSKIGSNHSDPADTDTDHDAILDQLPPEKLLDTNNPKLLRGGFRCMHSVETVQKYVGYENSNAKRTHVLKRLQARAAEIRNAK